MKFPYRKYISKASAEYPLVKLLLINPKTQQVFSEYVALVDSGASSCVFHGIIGEQIGVDVRSGDKKPFKGVVDKSGAQFIHPITLVLGGHSISLEAGFSYDLTMPFGLLGQDGFFNRFRICFDKSKGEFEITPKTIR